MKFLLGLLISLFCIPLSFSNEYVILSSTSPEIKDGQAFTKEEKIKLLKGERLEIMDESGNMFKIKGPYNNKIKHEKIKKKKNSKLVKAIGRLFTKSEDDISSLGATRSIQGKKPPNLWMISTELSGHHCLENFKDVKIWREENDKLLNGMIRSKKGAKGKLKWEIGQNEALWPSNVIISDDIPFLLRLEGASLPLKYTFHQMPKHIKEWQDKIVWMVDKKCLWQARIFLKNIRSENSKEVKTLFQ
ncbi:MAG: hypothetical protein CME68_10655 [Halobacteriovoraceae bacterium]|nr:hypothetical protein [Halobacteriovoraceae bacterium]